MSTPMSNPPASSLSPPPPAPPATPAPRSRKMLYVVVAVVVVVVVLLVAFVALPTLTPSSSGPSGPLTYSAARSVADSTMSGYQGGGWTLLFAVGLVTPTSESFPTNTSALGNLSSTGCTYNLVTTARTYTVPAFTGNRSAGETPAWEFAYKNASDTLAIASVINGTGSVLATITGEECAFAAQLLTAVPANAIDSSQAAADVETDAAAFLAAHPDASAEFALLGGISYLKVPAEWSVIYTTCTVTASPTGTGEQFNATVNAITGTVSGVTTNNSAVCGSTNLTVASTVHGTPVVPTLVGGASVVARTSDRA